MEFIANRGKDIAIQVDGVTYLRHAIRTHFVGIGEDYLKLIERYALPSISRGIFYASVRKLSPCANGGWCSGMN